MRSMKGEARPRAAPSVSQQRAPSGGVHTHTIDWLPALRTRQQQGVRADVRIASVAA
jgi:hypothetical protein